MNETIKKHAITIKLLCYKGESMKMGVVWMRLSFKLFSGVLIG